MDLESVLMPLISLGITFLFIRFFYNRPPSWVVELKNDLFEEKTADDGTKYSKIDVLMGKFSESIFHRVSSAMGGVKSGEVRLERGLQNAMLDDVINTQSPLLGMVMEQFPQVKGYLMKHPQAIPQVLGMIGPIFQGKGFVPQQKSEYRSKY